MKKFQYLGGIFLFALFLMPVITTDAKVTENVLDGYTIRSGQADHAWGHGKATGNVQTNSRWGGRYGPPAYNGANQRASSNFYYYYGHNSGKANQYTAG